MRTLHLATTDRTADNALWAATEALLAAEAGFGDKIITDLNSGLLGMFASVRLAHILRREHPSTVRAYSEKDLITAVRGRQLAADSGEPTPLVEFAPLTVPTPSAMLSEALSRTDSIVFTSRASAERFMDGVTATSPQRVKIISSWGTSVIHKQSSETPHIIALVTPLDETSGIKELIDTFVRCKLSEYRLRIGGVGKGRFVMPLIRRCRNTHADVEWYGDVGAADLPRFFADAAFTIDPRPQPLLHNISMTAALASGVRPISINDIESLSSV